MKQINKYLFSTICLICLTSIFTKGFPIEGDFYKSECERMFKQEFPESPGIHVDEVELFKGGKYGDFYFGKGVINSGDKKIPGINRSVIFVAQEVQSGLNPIRSIQRNFIPLVQNFQKTANTLIENNLGAGTPIFHWHNPLKDKNKSGMFWVYIQNPYQLERIKSLIREGLIEDYGVDPDIYYEIDDKELAVNVLDLGISRLRDFQNVTEAQLWHHLQAKFPFHKRLEKYVKLISLLDDKDIKFIKGHLTQDKKQDKNQEDE